MFFRSGEVEVCRFLDAEFFFGDVDDHKSTSGHVFLFGGGAIC